MPGMTTSSPLITSCGSDSASASSSPMMFAFRYISSKLAHRNVHLEFILDDSHNNINNNQGGILIPLRPLSLSEQTLFTKIAISAQAKFPSFRVQSRSLDRGALASSPPGSVLPLSVDDPHATATDSNKQSGPDPSSRRTRMKREHIFEVVDPIHLLQQSNIPHHVVFRADGLLVLSIDPSPSNDNGEEGEEFILHSSSSWSSLNARGGEEGVVGEGAGDMYDSPIYGFGLRDYFRNNPRLGPADGDVPTRNDNNPSHESEDDVGSMRRRIRDDDNNTTDVQGQIANRKKVARRPIPSFKGKEPSSSSSSSPSASSSSSSFPSSSTSSSSSIFNINKNNRVYPSSSSSSPLLQTPPVTTTHHHHSHQQQHQQHHSQRHHDHRHHRDTGSSSCNNINKIPSFEFALSEYPLYRRNSGLGIYNTTAAAFCSSKVGTAAATEGYDHPPPPSSHLMNEEEENDEAESGWKVMIDDDRSTTTMILGSEWESFRRIGLGVGGWKERKKYWKCRQGPAPFFSFWNFDLITLPSTIFSFPHSLPFLWWFFSVVTGGRNA